MLDKLIAVLGWIIPPIDLTHHGRWRLGVTAFLLALTAHVAWASGWVPGLSGFQLADEAAAQERQIVEIEKGQDAILVRLITSDIEQYRLQQCHAVRENNQSGASGWARLLTQAMQEYTKLAGREYQLRDCTDY